MLWFKALSASHPIMIDIQTKFGLNGYGAALIALEEAQKQNLWKIDITILKFWLKVKKDRAEKLLPFIQEILSKSQDFLSKSQEISKNLKKSSDFDPSNPRGSIKEEKNKKIRKKDEPPIPPKGGEQVQQEMFLKPEEVPGNETPSRFPEFWAVYPRKTAKTNAEAIWKRKQLDQTADIIIDAVKRYQQTHEWIKDNGLFIPYPATFLNQRRWEDDITTGNPRRTVPQGTMLSGRDIVPAHLRTGRSGKL